MILETKDILKKLRTEKGLSQKDVANALSIDRTTYAKWETGDSKPSRLLPQLARFYGVSADYILGHSEEPDVKELPKDLKDILENQAQVTLNGRLVTQEDKQKMLRILEALYYEAKEIQTKKK